MEAACSKTPLVDSAEAEAAVRDAFALAQQSPSLAYSLGASRLPAHVAACALPDGVHLDGALLDEVLLPEVLLDEVLLDEVLPDGSLLDEAVPDEVLREDVRSKEVH
jgi:hypothetical protein